MPTLKLLSQKQVRVILLTLSLLNILVCSAQTLDVSTCPAIEKRSNGNGQAARSAGYFPSYAQNNPVAANVTGTPYQTLTYNPSDKTGNVNFKWSSATPIANLPIITRVWITASGATSGTLSAIKFGPPPPPEIVGQNYYVSYSFYGQNMPPAGKVTLEFANPQTNKTSFRCTFDMQSNGSATEPTIDCSPTITTQPTDQALCGASTASFTIAADGVNTIQWQVNNSGTWTNLSDGGDYSGAATTTLSIANPTTYDGKSYRAVLAGSGGCGNTNSNSVVLIAKPKPTAVFAGSTSFCGAGTRSMAVNLTGTGPWSVTYSTAVSGGSTTTTTVSNISSSPFYFSASPSGTTTYTITSVSDAYCSNSSLTGNVAATVTAAPTILSNNPVTCLGSGSFNLTYTTANNPNQYSLTAGVRAMPGFSSIVNATLTGSPLSITIPSNVAAGVYDFNLVVRNSSTGCTSAIVPITVTVGALPLVSASAGSGTVCAGSAATLVGAPSGLASYTWKNQSNTIVGSLQSSTVTVNATTTYTLTGTDNNGCSNTADIVVTATAGPTLSITPSSPTICNGNTTSLTASGGNTYSWVDGNGGSSGLSATTGSSVVASPSVTTTYTVTSQNASGCQSVGNVTVTVNSPNIGVTSSATICAGGNKILTATGGSTYAWYPSAGLSATTGSSVTATPTATTTYYVVGTDANGCSATASSTITISAAPVNSATSVGNSYSFCANGTASFALQVNTTVTPTSLTWAYSTDASTYTNFTSAASPTGATLTPSNTSTQANVTVSGYSNGGYSGPRYLRLIIGGASCTYNYNITLYDTKGSGAGLPTPVATKTTVCSGETTTLSIGGLNSGLTVKWQSASTLAGTYGDIPGATSTTYTTGALLTSGTNNFFKAVISGSGSCGYTTGAVTITVAAAAAANTLSPSTSCTDGASTVTLTGSAISGGTYQWQSSTDNTNFVDLLGAVSQNYSLPNTTVSVTTYFKRVATAGSCSSTTSSSVAVYAPIASNQITNSVTSFCGTATATVLTNTTPTGGNGSYTYQWQSSADGTTFNNIGGATSQNYTTSSQTQSYWYKRIVTSGGCTNTSSAFKITVNTAPVIGVTANSSQCSGVQKTLTATGGVSYSWSPSTELSAVTGSSVIASATSTRTYTVTGTDANGCTATASSIITVTSTPATPTLSSSAKTICSNAGAFNLGNLLSSSTNPEWFSAPEASGSYAISGSTAAAGTYYVFSKSGSCYSNGYATLTLSVADVTAPVVAATALSYCAPATADLMALQPAAADGVTLEWHSVSSNPSGANIIASPAAVNSGTYYLYAYSSGGSCYGSASSAVVVTINSVTNGSLSATSASVCAPATIDLTSFNNTAGSGNTYSWYSSNSPIPANLVNIPAAISASGSYYLYVVNAAGCRGSASPAFTATVNAKPTAEISSPSAVCNGAASTISATTNATSPSYVWQVSTNSGGGWSTISNGGVYSNATTSPLSISNTTGLGGNYYRYIVTSGASCSTTSNSSILVEEANPTVSVHPVDISVSPGGAASFSVTISGSPTADFQWKESTSGNSFSNIADYTTYQGVNSSTLIIPNAVNGMNGYKYKVEVSNSCATNTSNAAILTINAGPAATTTAASSVASTSATIKGQVNDNGATTTVSFDWGTASDLRGSANIAATTGGTVSSGAGNTAAAFNLAGLTPGTTYYFRVKAVNSQGTTYGSILSFVARSAPSATTNAATSVASTTATINGTVNSNGAAATVSFDYGTASDLTGSTNTEATTGGTVSAGAGNIATAFDLTGLTPGTTYYFRVKAVNSQGTTYGSILSFVARSAPSATTNVATSVASTTATINGTVNSNGAAATVSFDYGTASDLTGSTNTEATTGGTVSSGAGSTSAALNLTGLIPGTTYYFRVKAVNAQGTTFGSILNFVPSNNLDAGSIGADQAICAGNAPATLTSVGDAIGGTGPITYKWQSSTDNNSFNDIPAATSSTYSPGSLTRTTYYKRIATTSNDGSVSSTVVTVTVTTQQTAASITGTTSICTGGTSTLANATTGGTWSSSDINVATINTSGVVTPVAAGTATISYTIAATGGCSASTATATVTVTTQQTAASITGTTGICTGGTSTLANATAGGTWSSSNASVATINSSGVVTPVAAGTATITYTIAATGGCSASTATTTVTVTTQQTAASITGTTSICTGGTSTLANATAGGTWSSSNASVATINSSGVVTPVAAGTATITYTIAATGGCNASTATTTVTVTTQQTAASITGTTSICTGGTSTLANATAGGTWSSSNASVATINSSGVVTPVAAGTATITYTIAATGGCNASTATATVTVTAQQTAASITGTTSICTGGTSTLANATAGGTWSSSNTSIATINSSGVVTPVAAGTATITYTIAATGGCSASTATTTVTVTTQQTAASITGTTSICTGGTSTLANATAGGTWSSSNASVATINSSGVVTPVAAGTATITYTIAATGGCNASTATATVTVTAQQTAASITGTTSICTGGTSTLANATAGGTWSSSNTSIATINSSGVVTPVAAGTATITYTIAATGGCSASTATTTVTVTTQQTAASITGTTSICTGGTSTLANATTGGTWNSSNTSIATINSSGVVTPVAAGTTTITYTIAATGGCSASTATATVTVTTQQTAASITGTTNICTGGTSTLANATAGGTWSSSNASIATVNASGVVTPVAAGTSTITYTIAATGGCSASTATTTVTITAQQTAAAITGTTSICTGGTSTLANATTGGTWSSSDINVATINTSGVVIPVAAGTATISYTIAATGGCSTSTATTTVTVTAQQTVASITGTTNICTGGTSTLANATAGGMWSSSNASVATINGSGVVTPVAAGTSTITYTIAATGGCSASTATTTVTVTAQQTAASITGTTSICTGGTSTFANATAGGTWSSSNASIATVNASGVVTPVAAGTSTITYTIAATGGCSASTATATVTVTAQQTAASITGTTSICTGGTSTLANATTGGTWNSSNTSIATINSSGVVTPVAAGTTTITYTIAATGGCSASTATTTVTVTTQQTAASITGTTSICTGGTSTLANATTGGTWSSSNTSIATINSSGVVTPVAAGTATITYTIAATGGCSASTATTTVTITAQQTAAAITGTTSICTGGTSTLANATAGGTWSSSNTSIATINSSGVVTPVAAGTSTISYTIAAAGGCSASTATTTVTVTAQQTAASITGTTSICTGGTSTLANATTGGTWSSSDINVATINTSGVVTPVAAGTATISYTIAATGGCSASTATTTVTVTTQQTAASITGTTSICTGGTSTLANATAGGTWSSSDINVATINTSGVVTPVAAGTATITYTIAATGGCSASTATTTVTVTAQQTAASITGTTSICTGGTSTLANATTGGTWSSSNASVATINGSGVVTPVAAGTSTITYTIAATGGCSASTATTTVTVTAQQTAASITGTTSICTGGTSTLANATAGGTWSSSNASVATINSSGVVTPVAAGTATITYTIAATGGCSASTATTTVTVTTQQTAASITGTTSICTGGTSTLANATAGGTWSSSNASVATINSSGVVTPVAAGTATITYTIAATGGCNASTATTTVTVTTQQTAASITGTTSICTGGTSTLANATAGGTWSSSNASVATINSSGVVTPVAAGTATITYTIAATGGCNASTATATVTVTAQQTAASITGTTSICTGGTSTLANATTGGTWSSSDINVATINTSGVVTSVAAGTATITYTIAATGGCSASTATKTVVVTAQQTAASITGTTSICTGGTSTLASATAGGTWSSSNTSIATINSSGVVTPVAAGTATITYTIAATGGCSASTATTTVTVTAQQTAASITGTTSICTGGTSTLANATTGGTWSSSNASIATVNASGVVTPVAAGTTTITYTIAATGGCSASTATKAVIINTLPATPNITVVNNCNGTSTLSVIATGDLLWSTAQTTPSIVVTTAGTYSVTAKLNGCTSSVSSASAVPKSTPADPIVTDGVRTGVGTVALSSTVTTGITVDWFAAAMGGTSLLAGSTGFTTPSISTTTLYYAQSRDVNTGCMGTVRVPVTAKINLVTVSAGKIKSDQVVCVNSKPATIKNDVEASAGTSAIKYFWQSSTNNTFAQNITNITGNISSYTPSVISVTTYFRRGAMVANDTAYSNIITITISALPNAFAGTDIFVEADSVKLNAQLSANTIGSWSTDSTNCLFSDNAKSTSWLKASKAGYYPIVWNVMDTTTGCISSDTLIYKKIESKIQILLGATAPKLKLDGTYNVSYTVTLKNTGNTDLSNVNLLADLDKVFLPPTTYKLIGQPKTAGKKINPNNSYTGNSVIDLIGMRTEENLNNDITYTNATTAANVDGESASAPGKKNITEEYESFFNNANAKMLSNTSLEVGDSAFIYFDVNVTPNGFFGPFPMNVTGEGNNELGTPVMDTSTDANIVKNTAITAQRFPTVVSFIPRPVVKVTKQTLSVQKLNSNLYKIKFEIGLKNEGNINLMYVSAHDNLDSIIAAPSTYVVDSITTDNPKLIINPKYDGKANQNLLDPASALDIGVPAKIFLTVLVTPNNFYGTYVNKVVGYGYNAEYDTSVTKFALAPFSGPPAPTVVKNLVVNAGDPVPSTVWKDLVITLPPDGVPAWCDAAGNTCTTTIPAIPQVPGIYIQTVKTFDTISHLYSVTSVQDTIWILPTVKVKNATYVAGTPGNPSTAASMIISITAGSQPQWCDVNGNNCTSTVPALPAAAGMYVWCVKAVDATSGVKSAGCIFDTLWILPAPPTVTKATYVTGAPNNPVNIATLAQNNTPGTILKWCDVTGNNCSTTAPSLPATPGVYVWCVKAVETISGLTSQGCSYDTVIIVSPEQLMDVKKLAAVPQLNTEGGFELKYSFELSNTGTQLLDSIVLYDDLKKVFVNPVQFKIVSIIPSGNLVVNTAFDGIGNLNMLAPASKLAAGKTDSVVMRIKVDPQGYEGLITNSATMTAVSPVYGKISLASNDPTNTSSTASRKPTVATIPGVPLKIPEGFSPNGDGHNDKFVIVHSSTVTIDMNVYNRWGTAVYIQRDYKNNWDGVGNQLKRYVGDVVPDGTYYYVIDAKDSKTGKSQKYAGFLTISR